MLIDLDSRRTTHSIYSPICASIRLIQVNANEVYEYKIEEKNCYR